MRLLYLEISNIGTFKGTQKLFLSSSGDKTVHLIFGANGSGRTILLHTILWALGLFSPGATEQTRYWVHKGCTAGYVRLRLKLKGQTYEIVRTAFRSSGSGLVSESEAEISLIDGATATPILNPQEFQLGYFSNRANETLLNLSLDNGWDSIERGDHLFKSREFVAWAADRLDNISIPITVSEKRHPIVLSAIAQLGLGPGVYATGTKVVGAILLCSLFREWVSVSDDVPQSVKPKNAELAPWLLDGSLPVLDQDLQLFASSILTQVSEDVVVCISQPPQKSALDMLLDSASSVSVIRVGWDLSHRTDIAICGQSVSLTRNDGSEHSEVINLVKNRVTEGWDEPSNFS